MKILQTKRDDESKLKSKRSLNENSVFMFVVTPIFQQYRDFFYATIFPLILILFSNPEKNTFAHIYFSIEIVRRKRDNTLKQVSRAL